MNADEYTGGKRRSECGSVTRSHLASPLPGTPARWVWLNHEIHKIHEPILSAGGATEIGRVLSPRSGASFIWISNPRLTLVITHIFLNLNELSFYRLNRPEICRIELIFFSANGALQPEPRPSAWVFASRTNQALKGRLNRTTQSIHIKPITP
jgi:hypothetical protein